MLETVILAFFSFITLFGDGIVVCAQDAAPRPAAQKNLWVVYQPYAGNPLRDAITAGLLAFGGEVRVAELAVECRSPQLARIHLRFSTRGLKFNVDPFEGPEGIGQKQKLLTIRVADGPEVSRTFNGFFVESEMFVFAIAPPRAETAQLLSPGAAGKTVKIQVSPPDGKGEPLVFQFTLPVDHQAALAVAQPCNESTSRDRESDPQ